MVGFGDLLGTPYAPVSKIPSFNADVRFAIKEKLRRLPDLSKIGCDLSFQTSRLPH